MAGSRKSVCLSMGALGVIAGVAGVAAVVYALRRRQKNKSEAENGNQSSTTTNGIQTKRDAASQARVIFVLGGPGSGKGTQCQLLANCESLGFAHLSAGDLLRAERNSGSDLATMINDYIREGKIVPAKVTVGLLRKTMKASGKSRFLIDGFPRNLENLTAWEKASEDGAVVVDFALFLDCPEDVMTERILQRGKESGRIDDNEIAIRKRLQTYRESTMPIIEKFESQGQLRKVMADRSVGERTKLEPLPGVGHPSVLMALVARQPEKQKDGVKIISFTGLAVRFPNKRKICSERV